MTATTVDLMPESPEPRSGGFPWLRTLVASVTAIGLTVSIALGIAEVLGASLGATALRIAGTGAILALYGLFAVGSATLRQRSLGWQVAGAVGVLCSTVAAVITVTDVWSSALTGDAAGRAVLITALVGFALGFTGFLLTHQRPEDTAGIRALMLGHARRELHPHRRPQRRHPRLVGNLDRHGDGHRRDHVGRPVEQRRRRPLPWRARAADAARLAAAADPAPRQSRIPWRDAHDQRVARAIPWPDAAGATPARSPPAESSGSRPG